MLFRLLYCIVQCVITSCVNQCSWGLEDMLENTHTDTHTRSHTDTHTRSHTDTHTHTHTHTHKHTHTHCLFLCLYLSLFPLYLILSLTDILRFCLSLAAALGRNWKNNLKVKAADLAGCLFLFSGVHTCAQFFSLTSRMKNNPMGLLLTKQLM